ncbi:MAG: ABC transporter ATP-binding protein, partial [Propionibacteriaceae bacterium]|nr:ABC transporter ATP-binding protein [Propionibacteriaceae bacterium]
MPTRPPILRITAPGWTQECDSGTHALVWRPGEGARLTASEDDGVVRFRHVAGWWLTVTDPAVTCRLDGELVDGGGRRRLAEGEARALVLSRRGDRDQVLSLAVGAAGAGGGPRRAITTPEAKPVRGRAKTPRVRPGPEAAAAPEARFGQGSLTLDFEQRYVVGSGDVDVRLSGADVAERHLQVRRRPAFVEVRSLSPLYYPIVDGSPCVYARLQDGGSMLVGHHRLTVSGGRLLWNTPLPLTHALEIRDLALRYRGKSSAELQGFSLTAEAGEVTAIVGPSGHGKTTLFRGLLGQVRNYSGSASLGRIDLLAFGSQVSHLVSFVPQATELFAELTVRDTLRYAARLRFDASARPDDVATAITRTMEQVHLSELADTRVSRLSGGERHRVSLALELLTEPTLLMLDEPTADLDAGLEPDLIGILEDFAASGHIVLLVTHSLHSLAPDTTISALARQTKEAPAFEAYAGALKGLAPRLRVDTHAQAMDKLRHWTDQVPVPVERGRVAEQPRDAEVSEPRKPKPEGIRRTRILTAREFRRNLTQWPSITSSALLYSGITLLLSYVSAASGMVGGGNGGTRIAILIMSTCFAFFSLSFSFSSIVADRDMIRREALWGVPASS